MNAAPAHRRATYADLEAVPPHLVAEIIDGRLETHHHGIPILGATLVRLCALLEETFGSRQSSSARWLFLARVEFHFRGAVLVPDLAGWLNGRGAVDMDAPYVSAPPNWACEILSPEIARLDRGAKRRIYGEAGISHYWLLDPAARLLECFALTAGQWLLLATFEPGDEIRVAPFDAVGFPMDALFPFDEPVTLQTPSEEA